MKWQSKHHLLSLLQRLVSIESVTGSPGESAFPDKLQSILAETPYFKDHPDYLKTHIGDNGGAFLTALVKKSNTAKTIILLSHFDVVGVEDYGQLKSEAFDVETLTRYYQEHPEELPPHVHKEIQNGDWVFGRGTMDMKAGLTVQLSLLEKAMNGEWDGNLLLVTVSDEEVGSKGMLSAVSVINHYRQLHNLDYVLCINSEPSFKEHPLDEQKYLYTGTIGKLLPSFYFQGKESHVGEPLAGLNASVMAAILTKEFELSTDFIEKTDSEQTPVLTNLMMRDLKDMYNVQTPTSAVSLFNLFYMKRDMGEIVRLLKEKTQLAAEKIQIFYQEQAKKAQITGLPFEISVMDWTELHKKTIDLIGQETTEKEIQRIIDAFAHLDEREKSIKIVQHLSSFFSSDSPFIVLFFSPPFYPAVSSRESKLVGHLSEEVIQFSEKTFSTRILPRHFFPGLCDLSYASSQGTNNQISRLAPFMPLFEKGYTIPTKDIEMLHIPVFNLGPYGSDPHQKTERLETTFSFEELPVILHHVIQKAFSFH